MLVRFWGTRGSIATPGPATARYGGNTSCVEVRSGRTLVVLDFGTGVRPLGVQLARQGGPIRAHLMLTHIHWDHIQGFPFFLPAFQPGSEIDVYAAAGLEQGLEEALSGQMQYTYFPVRLADLRSRLTFHEVGETSFQAGEVAVRTQFLNHPCPTLGYRLSAGGSSVAYVTDHEPFWPHDPWLPLEETFVHPSDRRHVQFLVGTDLLVHDAQYTAEEYSAHQGWGHATVEYVVDVAVAAGVRRLALFHHDPARDDEALDDLVERARARARARGAELDIFAAEEGQTLELEEHVHPAQPAPTPPLLQVWAAHRVLLVGSPEQRHGLREALVDDGYVLAESAPGESSALGDQERPDLVVVVVPTVHGTIDVAALAGASGRGAPVLAVLEGPVDDALLRQVGEQAADVIVAPFTGPILRARVRACLARGQPFGVSAQRAERPTGLDGLHLVDRLNTDELRAMLDYAVPVSFRAGEVVFGQGDPPGGIYYLHNGRARVFVRGEDGREITLGHAGPGDTVGEMSALDNNPRAATVLAAEPITASYISREAFRRGLERNPEVFARLLRLLAQRLREADQRIIYLQAAVRQPVEVRATPG